MGACYVNLQDVSGVESVPSSGDLYAGTLILCYYVRCISKEFASSDYYPV